MVLGGRPPRVRPGRLSHGLTAARAVPRGKACAASAGARQAVRGRRGPPVALPTTGWRPDDAETETDATEAMRSRQQGRYSAQDSEGDGRRWGFRDRSGKCERLPLPGPHLAHLPSMMSCGAAHDRMTSRRLRCRPACRIQSRPGQSDRAPERLNREITMRHWLGGAAMAGLAALLLAGCEGDSSSRGFSSVTITGEEEQVVPGNRCAVRGHATNSGNRRAHVRITYEAKNSGNVIATSAGRVRRGRILELRLREQCGEQPGCPVVDRIRSSRELCRHRRHRPHGSRRRGELSRPRPSRLAGRPETSCEPRLSPLVERSRRPLRAARPVAPGPNRRAARPRGPAMPRADGDGLRIFGIGRPPLDKALRAGFPRLGRPDGHLSDETAAPAGDASR